MGSEEQFGGEELCLSHFDPVVLELNRLQNLLKERDRESANAQSEIKSLKASEVLKDKAIEELNNVVQKLEEKLAITENFLEHKNLEVKKLTSEKRDALAAQYAAEATLRRVHANQKDNDLPPVESLIAPLEAEIKMHKNEIAALQENKKALERLTKSKELALLEAEKILRSALERALIVEEVQNQNYELKRQIEICQEENKILEKTNRQKVLEVEKLSQTIQELEEAILAGGAAANSVRDYQRQISELNEEKRTLERELARAKVSANRVATVVANEWKDDYDKVIPIKQWLEERRILQAEMQRIRDKLAVSERAAKAEALMKEKFKLRLKTLEEGLRCGSNVLVNSNFPCASPKTEKSNKIFSFLTSNGGLKKRSSSQPRASTIRSSPLRRPHMQDEAANVAREFNSTNSLRKKFASEEYLLKKGMWVSRNKVVDSTGKENVEKKTCSDESVDKPANEKKTASGESITDGNGDIELASKGRAKLDNEDVVSGFLYDRLQKEVIGLRKFSEAKDSILNAKEQEIQMLMKKVDTLTKSIEVESKKVKRETAIREKEVAQMRLDEHKNIKNLKSTNRAVKA
ncbi:microtubule-associated protein 70-5 [Rhodamnia argentea]|uniref:Microtubule-associated protein 70-5 n=1 Tax=Rhodamnia argentea TaxID=178133 RepID=A0A8B8MZ93_9MYRT|nr:microtubule-associated protein 70-5 [Rhodamnia argentea]